MMSFKHTRIFISELALEFMVGAQSRTSWQHSSVPPLLLAAALRSSRSQWCGFLPRCNCCKVTANRNCSFLHFMIFQEFKCFQHYALILYLSFPKEHVFFTLKQWHSFFIFQVENHMDRQIILQVDLPAGKAVPLAVAFLRLS